MSRLSGPAHSSISEDEDNTGTHYGVNETGEQQKKCEIEKNNEQSKTLWRFIMAALFFINLTLAGFTYVYGLITRDEAVQLQFHGFADLINNAYELQMKEADSVLQKIGADITSRSSYKKYSWPFHEIPHFGRATKDYLGIVGIDLIAVAPVISDEDKLKWESYSTKYNEWLFNHQTNNHNQTKISTQIFNRRNSINPIVEGSVGPYVPLWQISPVPNDTSTINLNLLSNPIFARAFDEVIHSRTPALTSRLELVSLFNWKSNVIMEDNVSILVHPIFSNFDTNGEIIGVALASLRWETIFSNILPEGNDGIYCVIKESCGTSFTFWLEGPNATFIGEGDRHDFEHEFHERIFELEAHHHILPSEMATVGDTSKRRILQDEYETCKKTLHIFPSGKFYESIDSNIPRLVALATLGVFFFTTVLFWLYDSVAQKLEKKLLGSSADADRILGSLFPQHVRDQLFRQEEERENELKPKKNHRQFSTTMQLDRFINGETDDAMNNYDKPIANLFPNATVLFADLAGFTAWSSVREPEHVFMLLETIYYEFDTIANRRGVFKVETVGDCYVAVTGLPQPRADHALVMAKFARDCLSKMETLIPELELKLGPGTSKLAMRVGIHSGPVTAGVLRGEKSRFQLFGDTVNTAARIESSGEARRIHLSSDCADLIIAAGKSAWIQAREDLVEAKGKGKMKTFWLYTKDLHRTESVYSADTSTRSSQDLTIATTSCSQDSDKLVRKNVVVKKKAKKSNYSETRSLVKWNCDMLSRLLGLIVQQRKALQTLSTKNVSSVQNSLSNIDEIPSEQAKSYSLFVVEEVKEVIELPKYCNGLIEKSNTSSNPKDELGDVVLSQLEDYVATIAALYPDNPFHNFAHASHVMMSVLKLLSRIGPNEGETEQETHERTYGITSDPLTQFSVAFSALIHDVDHKGVSNGQLVKENDPLAQIYKGKSVLEQNSVDLAWNLLMEDRFDALRNCIYSDQKEKTRFRQLIVNSVMATDIFDGDLSKLRKKRWEKAFDKKENFDDDLDRKATIVIEHLIQASDVAHTMQHWFVYRKWNECLFQEMYLAHQSGRSAYDPCTGWYKGELWFFDNYIIPLTSKLADCGVFGVSSDEYLNYARTNRREIESKGEDFVNDLIRKYCKQPEPEALPGSIPEEETEETKQ